MENVSSALRTHGEQSDLEASVVSDKREQALKIFKLANHRLLDINKWHELCGEDCKTFIVYGKPGIDKNQLIQVGDYFQTNVPIGFIKHDPYDWVKVELIDQRINPGGEEESCEIRIRAARDPQKEASQSAFFFKSDALTSIKIKRTAFTVSATYHGENEVEGILPSTSSFIPSNVAIAKGAFPQIAEMKWSNLLSSFLE